MNDNQNKDELPQELTQLKEGNPFSVPSGYFDSLTDSIMDQNFQKEAKIIPIRNWKTWASIAAGFIIISLLWFMNNDTSQNAQLALQYNEKVDYIDEHIDDIQLEYLLESEDIDATLDALEAEIYESALPEEVELDELMMDDINTFF